MKEQKTTNYDYEVKRNDIVVGHATVRPGGNYAIYVCCKKKDIMDIIKELYEKIETGKN